FGSLWIISTDLLKSSLDFGTVNYLNIDIIKGLLFVFITSVLFYFLLKKYFKAAIESNIKLTDKENEYKTLAENLEFCVLRHNTECRYEYLNRSAWNMLKELLVVKNPEEMIGLTPEETYIDPGVAKTVREGNEYVISTGEILRDKLHYGNRYISYSKIPEKNSTGKITSVITLISDETEMMESLIKLRESEKFNSYLLSQSNLIFFVINKNEPESFYVNDTFGRILGYSEEEIKPKGEDFIKKIIHPEDSERFAEYTEHAVKNLKDNELIEFDFRMLSSAGSYLWFKGNLQVYHRNSVNEPVKILGTALDITKLKHTEEELIGKTNYMNAIIDASPMSIFDLDSSGRIKSVWNRASEKMFGWKSEEVIGRILPIVPEERMYEFQENLAVNLSKNFIDGKEHIRKKKDGSGINIRIYSRPVTGKSGSVETILAYNEDITLEKKLLETKQKNDEYLKVLYEASLSANKSMDTRELYRVCFDYIHKVIDADGILVALVAEDRKNIKYDAVWVHGESIDSVNIPLIKLDPAGTGPLTQTIIEGKARIISNLEELVKDSKNKYFVDTEGNLYDDRGNIENLSKASIMIPLKHSDKVIGVLQVQNYKAGIFKEEDMLMLEPFAFIFASAIQRANLYKKLQEELKEKQIALEQVRKFSKGIEQSPNSIVITNSNYEIEYINPYFSNLTGYSVKEVIGKNPSLLQSGHTNPEVYKSLRNTLERNEIWHGEFLNRKKNGELYWEAASIGPIMDNMGNTTHYIAIKQDITEKKKHDKELKDSLEEKEIMLKEIHHRVKNNLQVISSLLNMQFEQYEHPEAIEAINSSRNRVRAMALVHESLYQNKNIGKTQLQEYILMLAKNIYSSYGVTFERIGLKIETNGGRVCYRYYNSAW
ncbi:MAG: Signal transduction histidine kinase, partial [Chlorobi bacterium OLB5]